MGAGTAKFKSLTALGEGHVAMLLDRGSIPLASTTHSTNNLADYQAAAGCAARILSEKEGRIPQQKERRPVMGAFSIFL